MDADALNEIALQRWETERRYYLAWVQEDLFGELELVQVWGGKGTRLGSVRRRPIAATAQGRAALERIARVRMRRGYCLVQ